MEKLNSISNHNRVIDEPLVYSFDGVSKYTEVSIDNEISEFLNKFDDKKIRIDNKTSIIVDHANTITTRVMHRLLKVITKTQAKLILFGYKSKNFNSDSDLFDAGDINVS